MKKAKIQIGVGELNKIGVGELNKIVDSCKKLRVGYG